jgi:hypothetical protein
MAPRIAETPAPEEPGLVAPPRMTLERRVVAASAGLFVLSLVLPALGYRGPGPVGSRGWVVLATGALGILILQVGWFANLLWLAGAVQLWRRRWRPAALLALLAALVAADSFMLYRTGLPSDSGGHQPVVLLAGFYVWWGSLWVLAVGAHLLRRRHPSAS